MSSLEGRGKAHCPETAVLGVKSLDFLLMITGIPPPLKTVWSKQLAPLHPQSLPGNTSLHMFLPSHTPPHRLLLSPQVSYSRTLTQLFPALHDLPLCSSRLNSVPPTKLLGTPLTPPSPQIAGPWSPLSRPFWTHPTLGLPTRKKCIVF